MVRTAVPTGRRWRGARSPILAAMVIGGGAPLSFSLPPLLLLTLAAIAIAVYVIYLAARVLSTRRGAAAPPRSQRPGPAGTSGSLRAALDWLAAAPDGRSVELK
ncbi:MAG: hypothetical protein ACXWMU_07475, partial [Candidatus Limnocylindrales bacterium]